MAVKSVLGLVVTLALILLVSQDVAYATDTNSANGGTGVANGGGFVNPGGLNGNDQSVYVVIYRDGYLSRVFGPLYGGRFGPGSNGGFGQPFNGGQGGFGTGFNGGFGQRGVSDQTGFFGGRGN